MPLRPDLIDILVCPKCKGGLDVLEDQSAFVCQACALAFKVEDDIPNFLIEEAVSLGGS